MKHFYTNSLMNRPNTERCTLGNENQQNRYGETHAFSIRNIAATVIMLLAVCLGGNVWGQVIEIGTGTSTNYLPLPGWWGWQYDVYLYTPTAAAELNEDCTITSIAFNSTTSYTGGGMTVWIKDVEANYSLAAATTFATYTSGATQVYNNNSITSVQGWNTFNFSSSFSHQGGKALLVAVRGVGCSTSGGCSRSCYYTSADNTWWYKHQDSNDPGTNVSGTLSGSRVNVRLGAVMGFNMSNNLTKTIECGKTYSFYDSGGPTGSYSTGQNYTATFTSEGDITINFSQFVTESSTNCYNWDYIEIYDGNTSGTLLVIGQTGCSSRSLMLNHDYTATSGTMTVVWHSDGSTVAAGWAATITATGCPEPIVNCEGFEGGSMPAGWSSSGPGTWSVGTGDYTTATGAHTGSYNAKINHTTNGNQTYLITPSMDFSSAANVTLSFWYVNRSWAGDIDELTVCYRVNNGVWQQLYNTGSQHAGWTQHEIDLPPAALAANCQIGFMMTDRYGYGVGIDDVCFTYPAPACTPRTANITGCPTESISSGGTVQLSGSVSSGTGTISWSTSNENVASVNGSGLVVAKAPGSVTITYTRADDGIYCETSATCNINVICRPSDAAFAFSSTTGSVAEDATLNIAGYLTVPTGATVTSYTSANTSIATVTNAGVVTGVSTGTTTITATIAQWTYNGVTYCQRTTTNSFTVTVTSGCDESFNLSGNMTKTINCGTTYCFYDSGGKNGSYADNEDYTATFISAGDITMTFSSFSTESCCDKISIYDGGTNGTVLLNSYGGTTIPGPFTATSGIMTVVWHSDGSNTNAGWKAIIRGPECCTPARTLSITDCPAGSVGFGSTFTLHAQASAGGGTVTWQSSNPNIATVNGSGVVECVGIGTVTIIATISASGAYCKAVAGCDITVACTDGNWNIDDIDGQTKTIECGKSYCFYDSGGPDGNYENNNENFSCSFSSSGIIHIKFIDFYTESLDPLTISGTYHDGAYSYTDISPGTEFVCTTEGGTINIGWTTDGSVLYRGWKAIVYAEGCCTHRDGESGFSFCRDHLNVAIGGTLTMPVDGADAVTPGGSVTYTSSNTNVATVDANGTVHGVSAGNAIITATVAAATVSGVDYCATTASYTVTVGIPSAGSLETSCEGFESGTLNGWTTSGDYTWTANAGYRYGTPAAHEGTYNAYISTTEWGNNESFLTSPVMDLSSAVSATLSFWYINQIWGSDIDEIYAYYRTNNSDTWHQIFYTNANHESWTNDQAQNISLPNLSSTYQITFKVIGNYGYGVGLDNICISSESSFTPDVMPELTLTGVPSTVVCSPADISIDAAVVDGTVDAAALSAALPSGLSYSTSTHKITGSLTTGGTYEFDITAKSDDGCLKDTKHVTITVNQLDATIQISNP